MSPGFSPEIDQAVIDRMLSRGDMRALFIEFNQVGDDAPRALPVAGAFTDGGIVAIKIDGGLTKEKLDEQLAKLRQNNGSAGVAGVSSEVQRPAKTKVPGVRRRIAGPTPQLEQKEPGAGIPDRIADVLAENNTTEQH